MCHASKERGSASKLPCAGHPGTHLPRQPGAAAAARHAADLALVRSALRGRRGAVDRIAERTRFVACVVAGLNRDAGNPLDTHEVADVAQDTMLSVWQRLGLYRGEATFNSWLFPFCRNSFSNAVRSRRRRLARVMPAGDLPMLEGRRPAAAVHDAPDPLVQEVVIPGLGALEARRSQVIRMRLLEGLQFAQIGERLRVPAATAKTWYYRGIRDLRRSLTSHRVD